MLYIFLIVKNYIENEKYMNELRLRLNDSDPEDMMTKKYLKKLKVSICTNKVHLTFYWLNRKNFIILNI